MVEENNTDDLPTDMHRRRFLAGAAGMLAGLGHNAAEAAVKPVSKLSREEAKDLLDSVNHNTLAVTVMLESGGDPEARNPKSDAVGAFQFISSTAKRVGLSPDERTDPYLSLLAAARLQRGDAEFLAERLGHAPKPYEVYLAHQQGAAGAVALINGGSSNAINTLASIGVSSNIATQAIANNGGRRDTTAQDFVKLVEAFYTKSATSPYSSKAGQKWVAHVMENQGLKADFLKTDPDFADYINRKRRHAKVENPEKDLRTYQEMKEYILIHPNDKFSKDFPFATEVINQIWGKGGSKTPEPPKKERFRFLESIMGDKKGPSSSPQR